jgi:paraquat-inducible protein B
MQQENFEVVDKSSHGTNAAMASIPAFLNGAIGVTMPDPRHWADATKSDAQAVFQLPFHRKFSDVSLAAHSCFKHD